MKKTNTLYIYAVAMPAFPDDIQYLFSSYERESNEYSAYTLIETREIEFEIGSERDIEGEMTANAIYALRKQKQSVLAESQVEADRIQDRINSLSSLENKAEQ